MVRTVRVTAEIDANATTTCVSDANLNLTSITGSLGNTNLYQYDLEDHSNSMTVIGNINDPILYRPTKAVMI